MTEATASHEPEPVTGADPDPAPEYSDPDYSDPDGPAPAAAPPTAVESVVNALLEAGPDVAEHVVRAAQELLLAAQTVVDAAQRAVEEQQALRQPVRPDVEPGGADAAPVPVTGGSERAGTSAEPAPGATVHRLDVGE